MEEYFEMENSYPIENYFYVIDVDNHVLKAEKLGIRDQRPIFIYESFVYEDDYILEWPPEEESDYASIFLAAIPRSLENGDSFSSYQIYYAGEWLEGKWIDSDN